MLPADPTINSSKTTTLSTRSVIPGMNFQLGKCLCSGYSISYCLLTLSLFAMQPALLPGEIQDDQ